ncbi:hypothetical protein EGT64_07610 [Acinetobacter junii]|nr:hypothetical protein EGT64_07610 [Acinetobacter junii]
MDYSDLQHIALEVCQQADKFNIPYKVYWYSPDSRKANPKSKIGHYVQPNGKCSFNHGCKCIILFKRGKHPANTALPSDPISLNLVPT